MTDTEQWVQKELFALQDEQYKAFHCRLMPNIAADRVIGVRTPALRKFARQFAKDPRAEEFLCRLPHTYYEENNLHGFLIEAAGDYRRTVELLDAFLPYVDNWATCDLMRPKVFAKRPPELILKVTEWMGHPHPYAKRFAMEVLMCFYLDDDHFRTEYPAMVAAVKSAEYYVNMMIAWYFATALAKQYDAVFPYLTEERLDTWTHNKTIQKAVESNRISAEQKAYLRTLRR